MIPMCTKVWEAWLQAQGCPQLEGSLAGPQGSEVLQSPEKQAAPSLLQTVPSHDPWMRGRISSWGKKNLSTCRAVIKFPFLICRVVMADWRQLSPPVPHPQPAFSRPASSPPSKKKTENPREDFMSGYSFFN